MRLNRIAVLFIVLLFSTLAVVTPVTAQDEDIPEYPAEINVRILGDIPSIQVSKWTQIDIEVTDAFGIDYGLLSEEIPRWIMEIIWPLNPSFPQPVKRYLGPLSIELEPEILRGNNKGWQVRMAPGSSVIDNSISGDIHTVTLEVQVDDSSIESSVVVGIKCTRKDTFGDPIGYSYINVPVKVSPTNFIIMESLEDSTKETAPKTIVDFELDIKNEGYYKDVFEFEIEEENGLMALMNQQAITLLPGETKRVTLEILTPEKFFDPGTPNEVQVYVRSTGNTTKTLIGSLIVITRGFHFSPLIGIIAAPIIAILVLGYLGYFYYNNKKDRELLGKPDKPWSIPEEKRHLKELKKKDEEKYKQALEMMEQEYQSALLWWKNSKKQESSSTQFSLLDNITSIFKKGTKDKEQISEKKEQPKTKPDKKDEPKKEKKDKKPKEKESKKEVKQKEDSSQESKQVSSEGNTKKESVTSKLSSSLKKWFTVPEEEKRVTDKSSKELSKPEKKEPIQERKVQEKDDYEKELDRIEKEQKIKRAQKRKQEKNLAKQKAMQKIIKAQEKQKNKL